LEKELAGRKARAGFSRQSTEHERTDRIARRLSQLERLEPTIRAVASADAQIYAALIAAHRLLSEDRRTLRVQDRVAALHEEMLPGLERLRDLESLALPWWGGTTGYPVGEGVHDAWDMRPGCAHAKRPYRLTLSYGPNVNDKVSASVGVPAYADAGLHVTTHALFVALMGPYLEWSEHSTAVSLMKLVASQQAYRTFPDLYADCEAGRRQAPFSAFPLVRYDDEASTYLVRVGSDPHAVATARCSAMGAAGCGLAKLIAKLYADLKNDPERLREALARLRSHEFGNPGPTKVDWDMCVAIVAAAAVLTSPGATDSNGRQGFNERRGFAERLLMLDADVSPPTYRPGAGATMARPAGLPDVASPAPDTVGGCVVLVLVRTPLDVLRYVDNGKLPEQVKLLWNQPLSAQARAEALLELQRLELDVRRQLSEETRCPSLPPPVFGGADECRTYRPVPKTLSGPGFLARVGSHANAWLSAGAAADLPDLEAAAADLHALQEPCGSPVGRGELRVRPMCATDVYACVRVATSLKRPADDDAAAPGIADVRQDQARAAAPAHATDVGLPQAHVFAPTPAAGQMPEVVVAQVVDRAAGYTAVSPDAARAPLTALAAVDAPRLPGVLLAPKPPEVATGLRPTPPLPEGMTARLVEASVRPPRYACECAQLAYARKMAVGVVASPLRPDPRA